ncbi:uncharacterized protein C8R40DRAFT_1170440 [Lentinula edodes]|uniref:uncharacterized protein n=1 Tax=Lentinula edodes TaxID=5353 RepID=UPI001E8E4B31|nr:uncharacterized protein C8R40DRAFT_1170440 [Lentinula edodes]KAH7875346.1 hypothetical protein C8R40DRAFT_1170440 [Lentinula edodes]
MSMIFAHPPHPSELQRKKNSYTFAIPLLSSSSSSPVRDPHDTPTFDSKSLIEPKTPILYLPPLLSSLPPNFPRSALPHEHPPLVTETRLPDIDPASLSLHKALHLFRPLDSLYSETPYAQAFNWHELSLPVDEEREWYCVVFRSKRKAGSDGGSLYEADKKAHEEAVGNGGLILYWYGIPNQQTGMNLATCIWQSRKHAIAGAANFPILLHDLMHTFAANSRPHHIRAMMLAKDSYEVYDLERYVLRKVAGVTGVTVQPFVAGEVGW